MKDPTLISSSMGKKTETFPPKVRNMTGISTLTTVIQHSIGSPSLSNQTTQRNKRHPNWQGWSQTFTLHRYEDFPYDTLYGKSKRFHQKLLELIHEFSKVAWYKINAQKSVAFLYTHSEATEREIKEWIPFTIAPKPIKYLGINLIKEVKNLYTENYRKLMKETEEDTQKNGKIFHAHGLEEQILLKCWYYPKQSTYSMQSLSKQYQHSSQS